MSNAEEKKRKAKKKENKFKKIELKMVPTICAKFRTRLEGSTTAWTGILCLTYYLSRVIFFPFFP